MGAISSLSTGFDALRRNPVLFVATFVTALLGSLSYVGQALGPIASTLFGLVSFLVTIVVTPFLTAGILGMAEEALGGHTSLGTLVDEGKANYLSMLGAYLLFIAVIFAVSIAFGIMFVIVAVAGGFALGMGGAGGAAGAIGGLGLGLGIIALVFAFLLGIFLLVYFLQFYDVAVVVSDEGAVGSLRRSASFVRNNMLSALGFMAVYVLVSVVGAIPIVWLSLQTTDFTPATATATTQLMAGPSFVELLPVTLATLVLSTLTSAFLYAYKVALYVDLAEPVIAD